MNQPLGLVSLKDLLGFKHLLLLLLLLNCVIHFTLTLEKNKKNKKKWRREEREKAAVIKRATDAKPFYDRPMVFSDQIKRTF